MSIWLRIGGYPATEIAPPAPPTWETGADGGCLSATFALALTPRSQHPALREGSLVEVMCGPLQVWSGLLSEPDRTTWECHAVGFHAARFLALDASAAPTRDVGVAIAQAIARGWSVANPTSISGVATGDAAGGAISIGELLDQYAEQTGQRWGVDAARRLYMRPDPTDPSWVASPDSAAFGTTSEDRAARLFGTYLDSTTGVPAPASAGSGAPEASVDLTDRGAMPLADAQTILAGQLARDNALTAWTNGVTLTRDQLQTLGGSRAFLPRVNGGQMVRSFGLSYASASLHLNTVIGKTRYTAGEESIYIEPINTAPRNFVDVVAAS